jgi:hypothetical protein
MNKAAAVFRRLTARAHAVADVPAHFPPVDETRQHCILPMITTP